MSLMTCAPGTEIYALFGHTALRYEDTHVERTGCLIMVCSALILPVLSIVLSKERLIMNWDVTRYPYFEGSYAMRGSSVYQQTLN